MRHGHSCTFESSETEQTGLLSSRLGCYFCNDVVAPQDVRTLGVVVGLCDAQETTFVHSPT